MGAEFTVVMSVISAVSSVVSLAISLTMKPDETKDVGTAIDRKGQDNPKVVPFGRCLVPSVRVFNNVDNNKTENLVQVHSFGVGKIREFKQMYIDGVPVFKGTIKPNTWYSSGNSLISNEFPNLSAGVRLGEATEAIPYKKIRDHSDMQWTSDCRGDRVASASLHVYRKLNKEGDNDVRIITDRFKVEAVVEGNAVIDPRFDTALEGANDWTKRTWVNSNRESYRNPACVILTYLLDSYYGVGLPTDTVDVKSFIDLANYCDAANFKFDGYVDQGSDYGQILNQMCSSFDGSLYIEDGVMKVKADKESPVVCSIDMDDLVGSIKVSEVNDSSYYNSVSVEFINRDATYSKDKYVLPKDINTDPTIIRDGYVKTKDIKLLYTTDTGTFDSVRKIANKHLKKVRNQKTVSFELDNTLKSVKVFDVVEITNPDVGLNKTKFRITKVETTLDEKTTISKITATEYNDSVYDDSDYSEGITSPPIKPPSNNILAPVNLAFQQTANGKGVLTWENRHFREDKTLVSYKLSSSADWNPQVAVSNESYKFENLKEGIYDFRVRTSDVLGGNSDWAILRNQTVLGGDNLPTITGLKGSFNTKDASISWDDMRDTIVGVEKLKDAFESYEVVVIKPSEAPETFYTRDNTFVYPYSRNVVGGASRTLRIELYINDIHGNRSYTPAVLDLNNSQCPQPSGLNINAVLSSVSFTWDDTLLDDYAGTEIHISSDPDFVPSNLTLMGISKSNSYSVLGNYEGIHYVKIGHFDVFDSEGIAYSPTESFIQTTIDDFLDDSANWEQSQGIISHLDKTIQDLEGNVKAITQIKHDVNGKVSGLIMGNDGETSTFDVIADKFRISSKAGDQAVFQVNSDTGKTVIREALIGELSADKIKSGVMSAERISSTSTLTVGSGLSSAKLSGTDANWRIAAGNTAMGSAPFRVRKDGYLYASNAHIKGHVEATSGTFSGNLNITSSDASRVEIINNQINVYENGKLRVRLGRLA